MMRNVRDRSWRLHRRRGTAIMEFAVSLPLLGLTLTCTFFFGWAVVNQNHVWISDRYACWRQVRDGSAPTDAQLNQKFFGGRAQPVVTSRGPSDGVTERQFVSDVSSGGSSAAGELASELVLNRYPKGLGVGVQAAFPTTVKFWQRINGAISSLHARQSVEWRWRQAACSAVLADQMLQSVDGALTAMPGPAQGMGALFRTLSRQDW
jgi:hypothetical protein